MTPFGVVAVCSLGLTELYRVATTAKWGRRRSGFNTVHYLSIGITGGERLLELPRHLSRRTAGTTLLDSPNSIIIV